MTNEATADTSHHGFRRVSRYAMQTQAFARGGMASVHLARAMGAHGFSRCVVIKQLHKQLAGDEQFVKMFVDEARIAARVRHPNVVSTLDIVQLEAELFIVMDYVHGEPLSRLASAGLVPVDVAVAVIVGALRGLHAAHEAKSESGSPLSIIHRDVTPQNILVDVDGSARVVDFGVARAFGRLHTTQGHEIKGKLAYMAPEQVEGTTLTRRVDIFQASTVLWELLTGRRLFAGEGEVDTLSKVLRAQVVPPSSLRPEVSPMLDEVIVRGLARVSSDRFGTAIEMADALESACRPAAPSAVARWLMSVAEEELGERADRVAQLEAIPLPATWLTDVESSSSIRTSTTNLVVSRPSDVEREPHDSQDGMMTMPRAQAPKSRWPLLTGIAAVVVMGALVWKRSDHLSASPAVATAATEAPPPHTLSEATPTPSGSPPAPSESSSASTAPETHATPTARATANVAPPVRGPTRPGRAATTQAVTAGSSSPPTHSTAKTIDCTVPFTIDAAGKKTYRPECF